MIKSLQAMFFLFAAIVLAIVLVSSAKSHKDEITALHSQIEKLQSQQDSSAILKQELSTALAEKTLLSDQLKEDTRRLNEQEQLLSESKDAIQKLEQTLKGAQDELEMKKKTLEHLLKRLNVLAQQILKQNEGK